MTEKEKAIAYDKAINTTRNLVKAGLIYEDVAIQVFPELAKSEDEKIRKALVRFHKNTIDKAEPKFRVGDWVVDKDGIAQQILSYKNGMYKHTNGYSSKILEDEWRMWDITKDAKDGDVLCTYECDEPKIVFVLKGTPKKHYALSYYCFYNIMYPHFDDGNKPGCLAPEDSDVKPATKEQRDLLFQKMKDVGYTFDFEKKELKKIEQKSSWSEEDVAMLDSAIAFVEHSPFTTIGKGKNKVIAWLKSLKDKVLPQPKQEWSEEDKEYFKSIAQALSVLLVDPCYDKIKLEHTAWFMSLKDRYTWRPSDEQLEALVSATENCAYSEYQDCLRGLIGQLKKLKEE